jgi:hypothetical protein
VLVHSRLHGVSAQADTAHREVGEIAEHVWVSNRWGLHFGAWVSSLSSEAGPLWQALDGTERGKGDHDGRDG